MFGAIQCKQLYIDVFQLIWDVVVLLGEFVYHLSDVGLEVGEEDVCYWGILGEVIFYHENSIFNVLDDI